MTQNIEISSFSTEKIIIFSRKNTSYPKSSNNVFLSKTLGKMNVQELDWGREWGDEAWFFFSITLKEPINFLECPKSWKLDFSVEHS